MTTFFGSFKLVLNDSLNLLFPRLCPACHEPLTTEEKIICLSCELDLPFTNHFECRDNIFFKNFEAKPIFESASALLYFARKTKVQRLIHQLKYDNKADLAIAMGEMLGNKLKHCAYLKNIQAVVPVPMHPKKENARGYNQAYLIAQGVADVLNLTIDTTLVSKIIDTESQASRSRSQRQFNLSGALVSRYQKKYEKTELLLIDDVSTSGATLEAVALCIKQNNPNIILHCATLAYTTQ